MFYLIEERDDDTEIVYNHNQLQEVIDYVLREAFVNGYIPDVETREELKARLENYRVYTDGDVIIEIVEKV